MAFCVRLMSNAYLLFTLRLFSLKVWVIKYSIIPYLVFAQKSFQVEVLLTRIARNIVLGTHLYIDTYLYDTMSTVTHMAQVGGYGDALISGCCCQKAMQS